MDVSGTYPISGGILNVYKYESFSYIFTPTVPFNSIGVVKKPSFLAYVQVTASNAVLSGTYSGPTPLQDPLVVNAYSNSTLVQTSSNTFKANPPRFITPVSNSVFTFYEGQTVEDTLGYPLEFTVNSINVPTVFQARPALPPGLSFNTSVSPVRLEGIPLAATARTSYNIVGSSPTASYATTIVITTLPGTVTLTPSITSNVTGMQVGTPIATQTITARYPYDSNDPTNSAFRFQWNGLPDGLVYTSTSDVLATPPYQPSGFPAQIVLKGTPTLVAAKSFVASGITTGSYPLTGVRQIPFNPSSTITTVLPLTFAFGETVLFDGNINPTTAPVYVTKPVSVADNISFRAQTWFTSNVPITNIFSPDLRSDLSLTFVSSNQTAYLTSVLGPTSSPGGTFTIRAINANATVGEQQFTVPVLVDTVTFESPAVDAPYNFILSRSLDSPLAGYYPDPIQFKATSSAGFGVTYSMSGLEGTGITLNTIGDLAEMTGLPVQTRALAPVVVTATSSGTPASATRQVQVAILNDTFTFTSPPLSPALQFIQNKTIDSLQFSVTTFSGRGIISYTSLDLPAGLSLSTTGLLTGAISGSGSGSFTVTASTGFASGSQLYSYFSRADNILIALANGIENVQEEFTNVDFRTIAYSGTPGSLAIVPSSIRPYQPTTIDLSLTAAGVLSGNLGAADPTFPAYSFQIQATAGVAGSNLANVLVQVGNAPTPVHVALDTNVINGFILGPPVTFPLDQVRISTNSSYVVGIDSNASLTTSPLSTWNTVLSEQVVYGGMYNGIAQGLNTLVAVAGANMYVSRTNGLTWQSIPSSNITKLPGLTGPAYSLAPGPVTYTSDGPVLAAVATDGGSNWVVLGTGYSNVTPYTIVRRSTDDGVTWADSFVTGSTPSNFLNSAATLKYNSGRYVLGQTPLSTYHGIYYADASNTLEWTAGSGTSNLPARAFAFNGTLGVAGSGSNILVTTDSGVSWSSTTNPFGVPPGYAVSGLEYSSGRWVSTLSLGAGGFIRVFVSVNGTTWVGAGGTSVASDTIVPICYDKNVWIIPTGINWRTFRLEPTGSSESVSFSNPLTPTSQITGLLFRTIDNGAVTATITIPYAANGASFVDPAQTRYQFYQYCSIPTPIPISVAGATEFVYYYAVGLPRGMRLVLDAIGISAEIEGTPVDYSDAFQSVALFASLPVADVVIAKILGIRVVSPFIQRPQISASAYTSQVRQYTEVNAAQNARDNRVFPAAERNLGEFMAPDAPDVITQFIDPKCRGTSNCQ